MFTIRSPFFRAKITQTFSPPLLHPRSRGGSWCACSSLCDLSPNQTRYGQYLAPVSIVSAHRLKDVKLPLVSAEPHGIQSRSTPTRLLRLARPEWRTLVGGTFFLVLASGANLLFPQAIRIILDGAIQ